MGVGVDRPGSIRGALVLVSALLVVASACAERSDSVPRAADLDCVQEFDPERDYFPTKAELRHAQNFAVSYHGHYKVLRTRMPATNWGPAVSDVAVLVRCGTPVPELVGELEGAPVIEVPVRRFATNSLASATRLRVLGLDDRIAALPADPFDPVLAGLLESGSAFPIGGHGDPGLEGLLAEDVDVMVRFTSDLEASQEIERARELGVGSLPLLSWAEPTYLGQVEWVKHHAVLFDAEEEAEAFFQDVEARYMELAARVADREPVTALWAAPVSPGRWWVEAGNWQEEVLRAAGGRNVFQAEPGESSIVLSSEQLIEAGPDIEVWITAEPQASVLEAALPQEDIAAWRTGRTWHVHRRSDVARDAFDWNETPFVRPDWVLEDLISVLHPDLGDGDPPRFLDRVGDSSEEVRER